MTDQPTDAAITEAPLPPHLEEILRPLKAADSATIRSGGRGEYIPQKKELLDMNKRFRGVEASFAEAYSQVSTLEKAIAAYEEKWQNCTPISS